MKVRVPPEKRGTADEQGIEYLDQTRIHPNMYERMKNIAGYIIYPGQNKEDLDQVMNYKAVLELFKNPEKLNQMNSNPDKSDMEGIG